ncbi:MAG: GNAT family N-acetyltransferase [Blastocatellia bacterium]
MRIIDLTSDNEKAIEQAARLLYESFREHHPAAWPTIDDAVQEVRESLAADRISRIAVDDDDNVIGWIGGQPHYDGNVWELHPLAVDEMVRGRGVGRALVNDLEAQVRARGGHTLWLGTDDENNQTTLGNTDLYPNVWEHVRNIRNLHHHPYEFYQQLGFVIVGVLPDANGPGKPDIFMARRISH